MQDRQNTVVAGALMWLLMANAQASVFGPLANFDVVNDTGKTAHGFEIEIHDLYQAEITSIFGDASRWPDMERYGIPTVSEYVDPAAARTGHSVRITYQSALNGSTWSVGTPSGTLPVSPSDSCWPYGAPNYGPSYPCDHFGVSTTVNTPDVKYSWLVETSPGSTALTPVVATVPNPVWTVVPQPPVNNQPQPPKVNVAIAAPKPVNYEFGEPRWVKVTATGTLKDVAVEDLLAENAVIQEAQTQVQVEWQLIQVDVGNPGSGQIDLTGVKLDPGAMGVVYRFEFYQYTGARDPQTNEAKPKTSDTPAQPDPADLGQFIVAQNAGINFDGNVPAAPPLPIAPAIDTLVTDAIVNQPYSQQITATPGNQGDALDYAVTGLPNGLVIDKNTGLISGTATQVGGPYPLTITVTDVANGLSSTATTSMSVVDGTITFAPTHQNGTVGVPFSYQLTASGGTGVFTYSTLDTLPNGLNFDSLTGMISGTPTTAGSTPLTFTAKDSSGFSVNATLTLDITDGPAVPVACSGSKQIITFKAKFWLDVNGGLANGGQSVIYAPQANTTINPPLTVNNGFNAGNLVTYTGTVDGAGMCAATTMTLDPGLTVAPVGDATVNVDAAINPIAIAVSGGVAPYSIGVNGLPSGLTFDGSRITGAPLAVGAFPVGISVLDANGQASNQTITIVVNSTYALSAPLLANATVGTTYASGVIAPTGGVAPYTVTVTGLPANLTFNGSVISGTPKLGDQASYPLTISATDGIGEVLRTTATLVIAPPPAIVLGSVNLPGSGTVGAGYSGSASATGGAGTLTWSATGLPAGVSINAGTGAISGTPTVTGSFNAVLTVKDSLGQSSQSTGTIKIGNPTLTVAKTNGSYGSVTSSPSGINCGTTCSAAFTGGVTVTLTAKPVKGRKFAGWSGACSGTTSTCQVLMKQSKSVTAAFK